MLREAWDRHAEEWIAWARAPGHDSYWQFHRAAFLPLVPSPGRLTLDVGCGEGRVTRDLAACGHQVIGFDGSPTMARAAADHPDSGGPSIVADAAHLPVADGAADLVVSFMALQDVDAMDAAVAETARVLGPGGRLIVAITHPASTTGRFTPGENEAARRFVVERSWFDRATLRDEVARGGLTMTFVSEHRPLQDYVDALADAGFVVERLREVRDPNPGDKWFRMPMFLHLLARR